MVGRSPDGSGSRASHEASISVESSPEASIPNADLYLEMIEAETEMAREMTGLTDWHYRDLPQMAPEYFDKFVSLVGEENLRWITMAQRTWPSGNITKRGQVMVSPEGMRRVADYNAASGTEARRAETLQDGSVHDGPVAKPDVQTSSVSPSNGEE